MLTETVPGVVGPCWPGGGAHTTLAPSVLTHGSQWFAFHRGDLVHLSILLLVEVVARYVLGSRGGGEGRVQDMGQGRDDSTWWRWWRRRRRQ